MCGIAGFYGQGTQADGLRMIHSIKHRGPDFQAAKIYDNVCLAHARLSIIDVSVIAHQPMLNEQKNISIVFNGEIYNYKELKNELTKKNKYVFKTNSDTEVLLYLYEEYGVELLQKINGMFSFAIYDSIKKQLFVARDRMGKKPFHYAQSGNTFVFASELKALLHHPLITNNINLEAINQYLTFDYVPTPLSAYKNIFKLEPAHYLVVKNGHIVEKKKYWHYNFKINKDISFKEATTQLGELLNQATASRLMSDVPLGVFLSGGLDSSTIAYYAQKNSSQKIKTFSLGFEDKSYDEQDYAQAVAKHLGTEHYSSILSPQKTLQLIEEIFPYLDEPFADASIIPTYYLSQFTRQRVTVALGGDGSDELLAGYPTFISDKTKFLLQYVSPFFIQKTMTLANVFCKPSDKNISLDFKIKQYLRGFMSTNNHIHQLWLGSFLPQEKQQLFKPEIMQHLHIQSGLNIIDKHFLDAQNSNIDAWHQIVYYYCNTYLLDDILFKVDRASMYNCLEVRAPFLDRHVVEFINTLPQNFKIKGFDGKHILKKLMHNKIPQQIIDRPKKGFGIPLSHWIRKELKQEIESVLFSPDIYFNSTYIKQIVQEHQSKKANHRKLIWNLFVLKKTIC